MPVRHCEPPVGDVMSTSVVPTLDTLSMKRPFGFVESVRVASPRTVNVALSIPQNEVPESQSTYSPMNSTSGGASTGFLGSPPQHAVVIKITEASEVFTPPDYFL